MFCRAIFKSSRKEKNVDAIAAADVSAPAAAADATPDVLDQLAAIQADIVERFLSRAITLTTGTTPTTGTLATVTLPTTRTNIPNCVANIKGVSSATYSDSETTSTVVFSVTAALTASTAYALTYVCGGA